MSDPEEEVGRRVADALRTKAAAAPHSLPLASTARRRVERRRQSVLVAAAAVVAVLAVGGVWQALGGAVSENASVSDSAGSARGDDDAQSREPGATYGTGAGACPASHPISVTPERQAAIAEDLDLDTPVTGLTACRYHVIKPGERLAEVLIGSAAFDATRARAVVDAIRPLPERNPDLPVFKCAPGTAQPAEAIALRFATAAGVREIWVVYDGCAGAGFFSGSRTYGLYAAPLRLFAVGAVRPTRGTFLDALPGW